MIAVKNLWNKLQWCHCVFSPRRTKRSRQWCPVAEVQLLEKRTLLAGNVAAALSQGDLVLYGDDADNSISIVYDGGSLLIRGSAGTTVNGSMDDFVAIAGTKRIDDDLQIDLRGGNDSVDIQDMQVGDDLRLRSGTGNDTVSLHGVNVSGNTLVSTGSGDDQVNISESGVNHHLRIVSSSGDDAITLNSTTVGTDLRIVLRNGNNTVSAENVQIGDDLHFWSGPGNDTVSLQSVNVSDDSHVSTGSGDDQMNISESGVNHHLRIVSSSGDDAITLNSTTVGTDLRIVLRNGNNTVSAENVQIGDDLHFWSGPGREHLGFSSVQIGDDLRLWSGRGRDMVILQGVNVGDDSHISTGSGDDQVRVRACIMQDDLHILSSSGDDAVIVNSSTVGDNHSIRSGSGNDSVNVVSTNVENHFRVNTSSGNNALVIEQMNVSNNAHLRSGRGNDSFVVRNCSLSGDLSVLTGAGEDFVFIDPTIVGDDTVVSTGWGNDVIVLSGANVFGDRTWLSGGMGTDLTDIDLAVNFASTPRLSGFSGHEVDEATIDANLNDHVDGALVRVTAAENRINDTAAPTAVNDSYTTSEAVLNMDSSTGLNSNDQESVFGGTLMASLQEAPASGVVTVNSDGSFAYQAPAEFTGIETFTYQLTDAFGSTGTGSVQITVDQLKLSLDLSNNSVVQSNDTLLTAEPVLQVSGTTVPNGVVKIDSDNDGNFDNATTTADAEGKFATNITLTHDPDNHGANLVRVRVNSSGSERTESFAVHLAVGTIVRFASSAGSFDTELFDTEAPLTVGAFLTDLTRFDNSFIHRSIDDFVIQGGGFTVTGPGVPAVGVVTPFTAPLNEFLPQNSNRRGTLATAQVGGNVNSFTGQYFVNIVDNIPLDNVPHTVFGRVVGGGMSVVDTINSFPTFNLVSTFTESALTTVPLQNYTNSASPPSLANFIVINSISALSL